MLLRPSFSRYCISVLALILLASIAFFAAEVTATVVGTVKDSSGAIVPGATVTLTNTSTGIARSVSSGADGSYVFNLVPTGAYQVTVEKKGFRKYVQSGITLEVNQNARVDATLQVGATSETVEVNENAPQVDTVSATLGAVENTQRINDLPLVGRDTFQLGTLQAGVYLPDENDGSGNPFSVNGQRSESLTFLINGADNTDFLGNNSVVDPNPDAVGEFKILTNNYNAEYGRTSGGIVNQEIKAGTNAYHGDVFEFFRNSNLAASNYFTQTVGSYHRNIYGGTFGGPIYKNKTFFFVSYQGLRLTQGEPAPQLQVLTPAERGCGANVTPGCVGTMADFSADLPAIQLVNPITGAPYPNNQVPINSVMANYIKDFLPLPNSGSNLFVGTPPGTQHDEQGIVRVDHHFSDRDTLTGSWVIDDFSDALPFNINNGASTGGDVPIGSGFTDAIRNQIGTLTWTHTFSPTLINEAEFSANRAATLQASPVDNTSPQALGFTGVFSDSQNGVAPPIIQMPGGFFNLGPSPQGPTTLHDVVFNYQDSVSWTKGNHNLKFGADVHRVRDNFDFDFYNNGGFFFGTAPNTTWTGDVLADFVGGFFSQFNQFSAAQYGIRTYGIYFYGQDTWKVTPRLTLDYGLRYELDTPQHDPHNEIIGFFPGAQSKVFPNAPPDLLYPGDPGTPNNGLAFPDYNNFAPRFGFAWDALGTGKLVVRGGGGIFYDVEDGALNLQFGGEPPFGVVSNFFPGQTIPQTYAGLSPTVNPMADPFATFGQPNLFPTNGALGGFPPSGGISLPFVVFPHFRTPYTMDANLGLQYQIQKDTMIEAYYAGSFSRKNIVSQDLNSPILPILELQQSVLGFTSPSCAEPYSRCVDPAAPNNNFVQNALDPNAVPTGISGSMFTDLSAGSSDSDQLQVTVDKRFSGDFNLRGAYTFSKTVDVQSGFRYNTSFFTDPANFNVDRGLANFDVTHRLVLSGLWDVPWDKPFKNSNAFMRHLTEGWELSGIAYWQSGVPFTIFSNINSSQIGTFLDRPDQLAPNGTMNAHTIRTFTSNCFDDTAPSSQTGLFYFNPGAYDCVNVPEFSFGNIGRNTIRGPGRQNIDLAVMKKIGLGEARYAELRMEAFNALNHTQFFNPNNQGGSSTFGQVTQSHDPRILQLAIKIYF